MIFSFDAETNMTNILFACLDISISSYETLFGLCGAACVRVHHPAPASSPISLYVNTRLKLRGSKGQRPLTVSSPFLFDYRHIWSV